MSEERLEVIYLHVALRGQLQETEAAGDDLFADFAFHDFGWDSYKYDKLAIRVDSLLPQVGAWLSNGAKGPNAHTFSQA